MSQYLGQSIQEWPSQICERQSLKNLKGYGLLKQTIPIQIFEGCLQQILLGPLLNNLTHFRSVFRTLPNVYDGAF